MSIRIRDLFIALVAASAPAWAAPGDPIVLLLEGHRREILPVVRDGVEMLQLDLVLPGTSIRMVSDASAGAVTLSQDGREVSLYHGKSLAAVDGDLRLLSAPALLDAGRWLVPIDGIPKLLGPLLDRPSSWRPDRRVLLLGRISIPKVTVRSFVSGERVRIVLEASEKLPFQARQEAERVTVTIARDLVDVSFQDQRLTGGIVSRVEFIGGRENLFAITLGPRLRQVKAYEQESPPQFVLDLEAEPGSIESAPTVEPEPRKPAAEASRQLTTVVIDPGHGGAEVGAEGPGGTLEKDIALGIARKLRAAITNNLGLQVFLTRDSDEEVSLEERSAIANNYKADVFISIHANASRSKDANGSEVYFLSYQATDDDSRRVAMMEGASLPGDLGPEGSDLAFILWDMAQAEHLEESSALASRVQEALATVTGSEGRGVKQAPFRVLVGAAMPAVLVEVAFISNPEEEKLLASPDFQYRVAGALMRGIARYRTERARRAGLGPEPDERSAGHAP